MRLIELVKGDIKFQFKYGFYYLYLIILLFYLFALSLLPTGIKQTAGLILIFTDPATLGMFFMGAIVLLEKSEHVTNALAVSPVTTNEYILSKVLSIGIISIIVGTILSVFAMKTNLFLTILILFMGSTIFTFAGLIVGANIKSINQYIVATIPIELIGFYPVALYLLNLKPPFLSLHPCYLMIRILGGETSNLLLSLIVIVFWLFALGFLAKRQVSKMFQRLGGVTL